MRASLIAPITVLVYALHQDFWFWRTARPLVFGFLPIGLFYHAAYTALISVFMWFLVRAYWPSHLEDANERQRVSHASVPRRSSGRPEHQSKGGAGIAGVPASERVGGSGGAKPPGRK